MDVLRYVDLPLLAPGVAGCLLVLVLTVLPALLRGDVARARCLGARVLFAGALAGVLLLTLTRGSAPGGGVNLVPGAGILVQLGNVNQGLGRANIVGNVALFVPLGLLGAPALGWRSRRVVAGAGLLSVAIELSQMTTGRTADIDDVLLNTLGAVIGAVVTATMIGAGRARAGRSSDRST
ncbi:MAG TPA: VanZ family protein [Actinomycetales bacterium]|jgi:hypothetical protein